MANPTVNINCPLDAFGGGCWFYRLDIPMRALLARGWDVRMNRPAGAVVQVFPRVFGEQTERLIRYYRGLGCKIVYEFDDDYWSIPRGSYFADTITLTVASAVGRMCALADLVTVPTEHLADTVRRRIPSVRRVVVLPNCHDPKVCQQGNPRSETGGLPKDTDIILVAGIQGHEGDFTILSEINRKLRSRVAWALMVPDSQKNLVLGAVHIPLCNVPDYLATLRLLGEHRVLGIVPLEDNEFNRSKSHLRWLEYTASGIPGVYGVQYRPYASAVVQKHEAGEWAKVIDDVLGRRAEVLAADKTIFDRLGLIHQNVHLWEEAYLSLY